MPTTNVVIPNMVKGPASATDDAFVKYDGTTGKLLKDGVLGSNGGNGASDGGKVVLFKSTGTIEGRCSATFGVRGTTVSGAGVSGESETGVGVEADATDGGIGLNAVSIGADGIPIVGTNATSGEILLRLINSIDNDIIEILSDGTIKWTNTTGDGAAGTRKNVLPSRTGNALKFLRINSDESDWEAAFVMREVNIGDTPTLVLGDGELAFDTFGTGFYVGDGSSTLADLVNGARNWWGVATAVSNFLQAANDLSDLNDAATARTNLGLGDLAVLDDVQDGNIDSEAATSGHVLTADGVGGASWQAPSGGGVPFLLQFDSAAAPVQRVDNDSITIKAGDAYVNGTALSWSDTTLNGTAGTAPLDTAGTIYVYLYDSGGGTAAFEYSQTAPTWDPTNGYQTKGGDADYMLIACLPVWADGATEKIGGFTTEWKNGLMETTFQGVQGTSTNFARNLARAVSGGSAAGSAASATFANSLVPPIASSVYVWMYSSISPSGGSASASIGVSGVSFFGGPAEAQLSRISQSSSTLAVVSWGEGWVDLQTPNTIYWQAADTTGTSSNIIDAKGYRYRLTR